MEALEVDIVPVQTRSFLAPPTKLGAGTNSNNNLNVPSKIDLLVAGKPTSPRRTSETPKQVDLTRNQRPTSPARQLQSKRIEGTAGAISFQAKDKENSLAVPSKLDLLVAGKPTSPRRNLVTPTRIETISRPCSPARNVSNKFEHDANGTKPEAGNTVL